MRHVVFILLLIFFPASVLFAAGQDEEIFHVEEEYAPLPPAIAALKEFDPANFYSIPDPSSRGYVGKKIFLSDNSDGSEYYAVHAICCPGSGGGDMWIVRLKDLKAKILISGWGFYITKLTKAHHGLYDLKFIGGGAMDGSVAEWSYTGKKYQLVRKKTFSPEDCNDPVKSKDPDIPWECEDKDPAPKEEFVPFGGYQH
jgi:hypothetical protein